MTEFDSLPAVIPERYVVAAAGIHPLIAEQGPAAEFAWDEFFSGQLRNLHTRAAYRRSIERFLTWVASKNVALTRVTPGMVGNYFDAIPLSIPSKKLDLSALRRFFDVLVQRHVIVLNPVLSVRVEHYEVAEGKTPEISVADARLLLDSIPSDTLADRRDKAIIAILIYTAARVGAVAKLMRKHYYSDGTQHYLSFEEKGGKYREIPVRHNLQKMIEEYINYIDAGELEQTPRQSPMFCTMDCRTNSLTENPMSGIDMCRMVKRRIRDAGLSKRLSPHSFRVCTITDLLTQGVALEDVQYLAGHADPRTTRLYDRRQRRVTRNIVERISV